ncbi:MAG: hypothetical protein M0Q22_06380 [Sulfuritalea sp.]|jgi:hypothetical protein|nr:hypothetical protein [Sulfuritalea sp.]
MPIPYADAQVTLHALSPISTVRAQPPASSKIAGPLERIAKAQETTVAQREAEKNDNRPTRNLAAQEEMAHWAKLSFLVVLASAIVSGLGLIALLYSLLLNRKATAAAQNAVAVARETNESQSRAWVSAVCTLEKPSVGITQTGVKGIYFNVVCQAKNHGRSPATGVSFHAEIALTGKNTPSPEEQMKKYCDSIRERSDRDADAIFPEASANLGHMVFLPLQDIEEDMADKDFKMISPVAYGCLNYKSIYTQGVRQTRFVYHVVTVDQTGQAMVLQPDQPNWLEQPIGLAQPATVTTD